MRIAVLLASLLSALPSLFAALLLSGCASAVFESRTDLVGDFFTHDKVQPTNLTPHLYIETAPEDFAKAEDGTVRYDRARYEYLGKIYVQRSHDGWLPGIYDFNEPWRRYYCPPVSVVTYGLLLVPYLTGIAAPCVYESSASKDRIDERKRYISYSALEQGMWIGATHLIFAQYMGTEYPSGGGKPRQIENSRAGTALGSGSFHPYTGMVAHAFKRR
jgi:hypothetical protein